MSTLKERKLGRADVAVARGVSRASEKWGGRARAERFVLDPDGRRGLDGLIRSRPAWTLRSYYWGSPRRRRPCAQRTPPCPRLTPERPQPTHPLHPSSRSSPSQPRSISFQIVANLRMYSVGE